jgi:hypothetical protein
VRTARCSALSALVLFSVGVVWVSAAPASADVPRLPHQLDLYAVPQNAPAQLVDAAGDASTHVFLTRYAPGFSQLTVSAPSFYRQLDATDATPGLSVVGDVWYVPEAPGGGSTPTEVSVGDASATVTLPIVAGERYLTGAGDHAVLLATASQAGSVLTMRTAAGDRTVAVLPAGTIGAVTADASTALLAFTPDGSSVPLIEAITLADGTVSQVNTTPLTTSTPLVALSQGSFAWSDAAAVVRVPRTAGDEARRVTGAVTALAVLDDATAWVAGGDLLTAVLDPTIDPIDHGAITNPNLVMPASSAAFGASRDFVGEGALAYFNSSQAASTGMSSLGLRSAELLDVRLNAGAVVRHDNSNFGGTVSNFTSTSQGDLTAQNLPPYVTAAGGRRLMAMSGRFTALGNAADTSVTVSTTLPSSSIAPGPNLTVPISTGMDTIELSGMRLLVHRPGSGLSQLYTLGSSTPVNYPLIASLFGARVAWLNADGAIQTRDLATGVTTTIRGAGTAACVAGQALADTTIRVAGDTVFWSLCGENRVHRISQGDDIVLPDGDMTNARLGTGALAAVNPATHVLSVTDLDTLTTYNVGTAPVSFDVDERYITWADASYTVHLAPLPFDNSDVPPQVLAEWGDTGVVPRQYTSNSLLTFWHHDADLTQPVTMILRIPAIGDIDSGVQASGYPPYLSGSISATYDGSDYRTQDEPPATPGLLLWNLTAQPTSGPATLLTGTLAVRDPRGTRTVITSWPRTLIQGSKGTFNLTLLLGNAGYPNQTVTVQSRPHGTTTWHTVKSMTTSSTGKLAYPVTPTVNTDYRFLHPGGAYGPASSTSTLVITSVAQRVTAKLSASSVRTGDTVLLAGGVAPAKPNQVVSIQRYYSGAWHTIANVRLSSTSAYRFSLKAARGATTYRVVRAADSHNLAGTSPTVALTGT